MCKGSISIGRPWIRAHISGLVSINLLKNIIYDRASIEV